jgi:DNA-binding CsgD family transcriptional regulator
MKLPPAVNAGPTPPSMLGLSLAEQSAYRLLIRGEAHGVDDLSTQLGIGVDEVIPMVSHLAERGLVPAPGPNGALMPSPPDVSLQALLLDEQQRVNDAVEKLEHIRLWASTLAMEYRAARVADQHAELLEVAVGADEAHRRDWLIQNLARKEVLILDKPPYPITGGINPLERERLASGVRYRAIYEQEGIAAGRLTDIRESIAAGEEARTTPTLPLKLEISDRRIALIPLRIEPGRPESMRTVLLYESPIVEALVALFELLWDRATPISASGVANVGAVTQRGHALHADVLTLLAAGLKDEVIAVRLHMSLRTVRRHIAAILRDLNVTTRFQAGLEARRRSLV